MSIESMNEAKATLKMTFDCLDNWQDRYAYIIELSRALPPMDHALKVQAHQVKGCQSQVWLTGECIDGVMHFQAASDAVLVSGLLMLLLRVYNKQKPEDIANDDSAFIEALGLAQHLSPTRSNGLHAVLMRIKQMAHSSSRTSE